MKKGNGFFKKVNELLVNAFPKKSKGRYRHAYLAVPFALSAYLVLLGYFAATPVTVSYDPAMHAEIVDPVIRSQIYPLSWSPLADTGYTYPPLFHWMAFLVSLLGIEPIVAVVFLGVILYAVFPLCLYLLGSFWSRKIGLLTAISGAVLANWSFVFLAGEYPQLLAMDLSAVFVYYYLRRDYVKSGVLLGLAFLSHPFVPVYLTLFVLLHSFAELARKDMKFFKTSLKCLAVAMVVASVWLPQYAMIVQNATTNQWRNVRWYYQPGFVGFDEVESFFGPATLARINTFVFLFSLAGAGVVAMGFRKRKNSGQPAPAAMFAMFALFAFTLVFSLFHVPGTQYKFPDMLSLAVPPLFALGLFYTIGKSRGLRGARTGILIVAACLLAYLAYSNGTIDINAYMSRQSSVSTDQAREAAHWLKAFDPEYSRIMKTGDDEMWFSVLSHKYAMDPMITDLEVLTENTKSQMNDRLAIEEKIKKAEPVSQLAEKYGIRYVITEGIANNVSEGRLIYEKNGIRIFEFPGQK
jgi:hypothetical protein